MKLKDLTPFPFGAKAPRPELTKVVPFGRMEAAAVLLLVAGLSGCVFGQASASGSLHFEGADRMGRFSGEVTAWNCQGSLKPTGVIIQGARGDVIDTGTEAHPFVIVSTKGASWTLRPSDCRALDLRLWFDADNHQHVALRVDCTTEGVHVAGSVRSECSFKRPGTPVP